MDGHALLVDEGVMGVIAEELEVLAGRLQAMLEARPLERDSGAVAFLNSDLAALRACFKSSSSL